LNPISQNHLKNHFTLSLIALFASCKSSSVITSSSAENKKESANQIIDEIISTASENIGFDIKRQAQQKQVMTVPD
jgi:hypothetical protein